MLITVKHTLFGRRKIPKVVSIKYNKHSDYPCFFIFKYHFSFSYCFGNIFVLVLKFFYINGV